MTNGISLESKKFELSPVLKTVLAGGIAGCVGKTVTAPLSRLTILYQVAPFVSLATPSQGMSPSLSSGQFSGTLFTSVVRVLKEDGILSFWNGNLASVIHRFPYSAINFSTYEYCRKFTVEKIGFNETPMVRLFCGAIAGGIACFACYPLDLLRTRLTVMQRSACGLHAAGITNSITHIIKSEGLRGLYKGSQ